MSLVRLFIWIFLVTSTSAMGQTISVDGPAGGEITAYLQTTKTKDCPILDQTECTLASKTITAQTFYGQFPNDVNYYSVTFLVMNSGGSGAELSILIMKSADKVTFSFYEMFDNMYGGNPRDIHFGEHRLLSWSGLIDGPDDPHCCPTEIHDFSLFIKR